MFQGHGPTELHKLYNQPFLQSTYAKGQFGEGEVMPLEASFIKVCLQKLAF